MNIQELKYTTRQGQKNRSCPGVPVLLRMTARQHAKLKAHLYPGDGYEAAALALCGRLTGTEQHVLCIHEIVLVPYTACIKRTPTQVEWPLSEMLLPLLRKAERLGLAIVKLHSHPNGLDTFSRYDDVSDHATFEATYAWLDGDAPHASAIMLPDGRIFGRVIRSDLSFEPLVLIAVAGDDFRFWYSHDHGNEVVPEHALRHAQLFGAETTLRLQRLRVAVVGCSGTGSPVVEMLGRLGVGKLLLVDPDEIEEKNLNRILNAKARDIGRSKVEVLAEAVRQMGTGVRVKPISETVTSTAVARLVAGCDVIFGCVDSREGRDVLNRIASYYLVPYIDIGVGLVADGAGGVDEVTGAVHVIQPDGSSLMSRGVYTPEELAAEALHRQDPETYERLLKEKYIAGVEVDSPAVVSVNVQVAAMAVNELLARIHPYRIDPNERYAVQRLSLTAGLYAAESEGAPCPLLSPRAGRGDLNPLLELPAMSRPRAA